MNSFDVKKAIIVAQAKWLRTLADRIEYAAEHYVDEYQSRNNGTITNLCPEVAKAAAKLRKMVRSDYLEESAHDN